jgi:type IV pilus assembly protein PilE
MIVDRKREKPRDRRGFTLMEVVVVLTIMGVLIAIPIPTFQRAIEQSKLDVAAGHLRSIWAAQRFYRLEHGRYGSLADLAPGTAGADNLVEPSLISGTTFYDYSIALTIDGQSFVATALHPVQTRCTGSLTIDDGGTLVSGVTYNGEPMTPSMEPGP